MKEKFKFQFDIKDEFKIAVIWIKILLPDTKQGLLAYLQRFPFFLCWTIWVTETKSVPAERQGPQFQGWTSNFEPEPCQITHQTYCYSQPLSSDNAWHKIVSYWEKGSLFIPLSVDEIKIWQTEIKLTLTSGPSESHGTFTIETTTKVMCHASSAVLTWIWLTFIFLWGSKQDSWNTISSSAAGALIRNRLSGHKGGGEGVRCLGCVKEFGQLLARTFVFGLNSFFRFPSFQWCIV